MARRILMILGVVSATLLVAINFVYAQESGPQTPDQATAVLGTAFTYQGQLKSNGTPINDSCDFQLYLYDSSSGTGQIGSMVNRPSIQVANGYFTITNLDFGSNAFTGDARWLRIDVRCPAGSGSYTTLSPRQSLTPAPYALALPGLYTQQNATSPNVIGGYNGNSVTAGRYGATIGGGGFSGNINQVTDNFGTVGGGNTNTSGSFATVGGGYHNSASGLYATVGGGYDNSAISTNSLVGGGLRNTASNNSATVAGGIDNEASGLYATIGGGEHISVTGKAAAVAGGSWITVTGDYAAVGGGGRNAAMGDYSTVGGGLYNAAQSTYSTIAGGIGNTADYPYAAIGGGSSNTAHGNHATVVGGTWNQATADYAFIGGGSDNTASGDHSTIPGGTDNAATGRFGFAAGTRAKSNHDGTFVWADSTNGNFASTANNQFLIRATGGVGVNTNSTYTNALTVDGRVIAGGTGVPTGSLEPFVARGSSAGISLDDRSDADARWVVYANSGSLRFWNGTERASLSSGGVLTVGGLGSAGSTTLCRNASNQIATCSSSIRYKNNVSALGLGLETIAQLRPVTFDWTGTGEHDLGFVAEEVDRVAPLLTTRNAEGQVEGVKYDRVSAVLVKAVQEQQQQIAELKQQNADLQARLAGLNPTTAPASFNVFNLLSVLACGGFLYLLIQARHSTRER